MDAQRIAELDETCREAWDALAAAHPGSGFMQSWAWSRFKELEGYRALRLGLFKGGVLSGGAIAYSYPSPAEAGLLVIPDGPLLDWGSPDFGLLIDALRNRPEHRRAVAVRVEPRLEQIPEVLAKCPRSPVDLVPEQTLIVALGAEEEMAARMKPKGRYNARLALRKGVKVEMSTDPADIGDFHFILEQTARYQGFQAEPKSFFINMGRALFPQTARLAFARYQGMTLAAALAVRHGDTLTYLYGGHLPLFKEVMANYALHWQLMRQAAREGLRFYDFYGFVPPGDAGHPYDAFSRFKEKFGGRAVQRMGSRDVVFYDRLAEAALEVIRATPEAA